MRNGWRLGLGVLALGAATMLTAGNAYAQATEDFGKMKAKHIRIVEQEISILSEYLTCASRANDAPALRACDESRRHKMGDLRRQEGPPPGR